MGTPGRHFGEDEVGDEHCRVCDDECVGRRLALSVSSDSEADGGWLPCKSCDESDGGEDDHVSNESGVWSHLPEDLLYMILALLPSRSILRFRYVCRQWKYLFSAPRFYHFASHQNLVPAWIFLSGSRSRTNFEACPSKEYDYSRDKDQAMTYVKGADGWHANRVDDKDKVERDFNFEDKNVNRADNQPDDDCVVSYGGVYSRGDAYGGSDEGRTCARHGSCAERGGEDRTKSSPPHFSFPDASQETNKGMIVDGIPGDTHGSVEDEHGFPLANIDDGGKQEADFNRKRSHCNGCGYSNKDNDLLLIFDCESRTWLPPLAIPAGIKGSLLDENWIGSIICSLRDRILIPAGVPHRICIENPASLLRQELPSFISIQGTPHALGLAEEKAILYTLSDLQYSEAKDFPSIPHQSLCSNPFVQSKFRQDHTSKDFQVVAVGETCNGTLVLEIFSSSIGSWHVGAIFPSNFIFYQTKFLKCDGKTAYQTPIIECNGCFFTLLGRPDALVLMRSIETSRNVEWSLRDLPWPPTPDGVSGVHLWESSLVACRSCVFLIGATKTYLVNQHYQHDEYFWGILIWRFLPQFLDDTCWQLVVAMPRSIFEEFYGGTSYLTPECLAHEDVIFFQAPNSHCILMYDVTQDMWAFSQECDNDVKSMLCVWEPLIIN